MVWHLHLACICQTEDLDHSTELEAGQRPQARQVAAILGESGCVPKQRLTSAGGAFKVKPIREGSLEEVASRQPSMGGQFLEGAHRVHS